MPASSCLPHDVTDGGLGLAREGGGVDGLAAVLAHEEIAERRRTGQAADVGGQDAVLAAFHGGHGAPGTAAVSRRAGLCHGDAIVDVTRVGRRAAPCR